MVGRDLKANKQSLKLANIELNENGLIKGVLKSKSAKQSNENH